MPHTATSAPMASLFVCAMLPSAAAWRSATMLRVQASPRASAATMTFALPTPEPEAIFAKIFDTANLGGVVNSLGEATGLDVGIALPASAVLALIAANAVRAATTVDPKQLGTGFDVLGEDSWTPAMKEAYAYKVEKMSFKNKFVMPVVSPIKEGIEGFAEGRAKAAKAAKAAAEAKKEAERKETEKWNAVAEGKAIELPGLPGLVGVVVPLPTAVASDAANAAKAKATDAAKAAKELLPF